MTKTLTEQWQKGKLPNGDYYMKVCGNLTGKEFFVYDNYINGKWKYTLDRNVIDIIAPVPSCNDFIKLINKIEQLEKRLEVSEKAHDKTLELLRIATKALKELEMKSDILYRGRNDWTIVEQLDFIKAKSRETLYQLEEMKGVK